MKRCRNIPLILFTSLIFAGPAPAQTPVAYPALGIAFEVPDGWTGQEAESMYVLQHQASESRVVVLAHDARSVAQLRQGAAEGIQEGDAILMPSTEVEAFGETGIRVDLEGLVDWSRTKAHAIALLSPHGKGVTVLALAGHRQFSDQHRRYAEQVARSVVFSKAVIPPVVKHWRNRLQGAKLTYLSSSGSSDSSSTTKREYTLCRGYFTFYGDHSGYVSDPYVTGAGASMASQSSAGGTWTVAHDGEGGAELVLVFQDDREVAFSLSEEDGATYLDDTRYFHTEADCQ